MKVALDSKISATITWIAGVVAVAVACALPATFFVSSYWLQKAVIDTEAEINARLASQVINANPTLWRFQQQKFEEFLQRRPHQGDHEIRRIVNLEGKMIAESADPITAPWMWRSRDILDAGVKVGEIQIGRSLRPLVYQTAGVGLAAAALGLCAFVAVRVLPLRALNRALAENTKLVEETKRAEEVQKFLKELSQDIASLNIDSLLRKLTEKVREFFKADVADVRIIEKGVWKVKGVSGIEPEKVQSDSTGTSRGRSGWIIQNRQPLLVPDIIKQTGVSGGESIRKAGIRGYVGVPLFSRGGEVIGILRVLSYEPREFSESEVDLLQQLANGAAIALTNARLYDETERRRREAEELARVARSLTATLDMRAVGERIVTSVRELFGVKASTLRLLQPDGSLRALASAGEAFSTRSGEDVLVAGTGLASVAVAEGRPIWSADVLNEPRIRLTDQMRDYQLRSGDRSMIAVPLRAHETIIGSLGLADRTGRIYSDSEVALAQTFADQAALALENARLFEETEQRAQEQAVLNAIAMATSQSLHLDELLQISLDRVLDVTGRDKGYIRLKDPISGKLRLVAHRGISKEYVEVLVHRRTPGGKSDQVLESGEVLVINDPEGACLKEETRREGRHCLIWVPLKARGTVVGLLNLSTEQPIPFAHREVELLQAIGNVIGVALENARLFQSTQQALERVRALHEIDNAITSTLDLRTVLDVLMEKIDLVLPYSATTVRLFNEASGFLEPIACRNLNEKEWKADKWRGGRGIPNVVFESKAPWTVRNVQTDPSIKDTEFFRKHSLVSYLGVPLVVKAEILGVLGFYTREEHDFSAEEVEFLTTLASEAAIAIHNSQLYEQSRRQAMELERSNAELEQFAYVASHDLQEPLRMVTGYTQLLAKRYGDKLDQNANEYIDYAVDGAKRMQALIHDLLTYSRVGTRAKEFAPTDCGAVVAETLRALQPAIEESAATVTHDPLPTVMGDESQLLQLFQNLIGNAIKYRGGKPPVVQVSCRQGDDHWLFSVRDNGIGIDPKYAERIFVIFQRLHGRDQYAGTGIGLAVCKKIVERHGGKIWVESELGKGATFYFTMAAAAVDGRASDVGE
jgi:GAF domain-containing protein